MADIVIETGSGSAPLVDSSSSRSSRSDSDPVEQNTALLPVLSEPFFDFVEDTVSISSTARRLQFSGKALLDPFRALKADPPLSANPFVKTYQMAGRLPFHTEEKKSHRFTVDHIDISERAYQLSGERLG